MSMRSRSPRSSSLQQVVMVVLVVQLQLVQPEDYGKTVKSLAKLIPQVAEHRRAEAARLAR